MLRFALVILALSVVILALVFNMTFFQPAGGWSISIIVYLAIITLVPCYILERLADPQKFTWLYLLSITIRIFISCLFAISFILLDPAGINSNTVLFLAGYVIFTAAEVIFLWRRLNARTR